MGSREALKRGAPSHCTITVELRFIRFFLVTHCGFGKALFAAELSGSAEIQFSLKDKELAFILQFHGVQRFRVDLDQSIASH